jgi:hypothetical protein
VWEAVEMFPDIPRHPRSKALFESFYACRVKNRFPSSILQQDEFPAVSLMSIPVIFDFIQSESRMPGAHGRGVDLRVDGIVLRACVEQRTDVERPRRRLPEQAQDGGEEHEPETGRHDGVLSGGMVHLLTLLVV